MLLESISFCEFAGKPREWQLKDCKLGNINLIVGKNASGKTRTLNIINNLARMLAGEIKLIFDEGDYRIVFNNKGKKIGYSLKYADRQIVCEQLHVPNRMVLDRGNRGEGLIYYKVEGKSMRFQTPRNELASVARRDTLQHPFLEDLYKWGKSVVHYQFGSALGQDAIAVLPISDIDYIKHKEPNLKDTKAVVAKFQRGVGDYGGRFIKSIIKDMKIVGFKLSEVAIQAPTNITFSPNIIRDASILAVKELDLPGMTQQTEMSQGMFRCLSLIIQIEYSLLAKKPSCIIIDDIGEGLDYERSCALVKLLVEKAKDTSIQLIMSSNDRFVMNTIPIEFWSIIQRKRGICKVYNQINSPKLFNSFKLTGLSNFDFFSSNYYLKDARKN